MKGRGIILPSITWVNQLLQYESVLLVMMFCPIIISVCNYPLTGLYMFIFTVWISNLQLEHFACLIPWIAAALIVWSINRLRSSCSHQYEDAMWKLSNKAHILPMCLFNWAEWKECWGSSIRSHCLEQETNWSCKTSPSSTNQLIIDGLQWSRES